MTFDMQGFRENSIAYCVKQNSVGGLAEAIAICISNIRDEDGKHLYTRLSADFDEHLEFCVQIARQLKEAGV